MVVTDPLTQALTAQAWFIANKFWMLLNTTGIAAFMFVVIVCEIWTKALQEGADEGNKAQLAMNRATTQLIMAGLVLMLAVIPTYRVKLATLTYDIERSKQCGVAIVNGNSGESNTEIDGQAIYVPVIWALWHSLAQGLTAGGVSAIPCEGDLSRSMLQLQEANITNPILQQEVQDFYRQCYSRARVALNTAGRQGLVSGEDFMTANWLGGKVFFETRDKAKFSSYQTLQTRSAVFEFPYKSSRDDPMQHQYQNSTDIDTQQAYPMCAEWWASREPSKHSNPSPTSTGYAGLKWRLYEDLLKYHPDISQAIVQKQGIFDRLIHGQTTSEDRLDMYLERVLSPQNQKTQGRISHGYGNLIDTNLGTETVGAWNLAAGTAGLAVGTVLTGPVFFIIREALPIIQAMMQCVLIISSPIVLVMARYRMETLLSLLVTYFGLVFLTFWWELCRFFDTKLTETVYGAHQNFNPITMINNTLDDGILKLALAVLYLVIPMIWMGLLAYAGYKTNAANIDAMVEKMGKVPEKGVQKLSSK